MIGVDGITGLPTTTVTERFDMIQNHVDLLSGRVYAVVTRATARAPASDAAEIIRVIGNTPRTFANGRKDNC
jgi:hypothetical protein